jgi:Spherulation-specific family 4
MPVTLLRNRTTSGRSLRICSALFAIVLLLLIPFLSPNAFLTNGAKTEVLAQTSTSSSAGTLHKANTGILVPFYLNPFSSATGLNELHSLMNLSREYPLVPIVAVVNPNNGQGDYSSDAANTIGNFTSSSITVLGYVWTAYGNQSQVNSTLIEHEIDHYHEWYANKGLAGIFFDGMSNKPGNESYYSMLTDYAKQNDSFTHVFGNPGTHTLPSYIGTVDTMNIFESGPTIDLNSSFVQQPDNWSLGYYKGNFSAILYGQASMLNQSTIDKMSVYLGYMYVTNASQSGNHFNYTSPYIATLAQDLNHSSVSLNIKSDLLNGTSIPKIYDVIYSGAYSNNDEAMNVTSPYNFNASEGWTYVVKAENSSGAYKFSRWSTGSSNPILTVTPTQDMNLTAYYSAPATLKVESVNESTGQQFSGMYVTIKPSDNNQKSSGYTSMTFNITTGTTYLVTAYSYKEDAFNHWSLGGIVNSTIAITPSGPMTLIAYYSLPTLKVESEFLNGTLFTGMYTCNKYPSGALSCGFTTMTWNVTLGDTYYVTADNYENYVFSHWSNGNTNPTIAVTPWEDTILVAYYNYT